MVQIGFVQQDRGAVGTERLANLYPAALERRVFDVIERCLALRRTTVLTGGLKNVLVASGGAPSGTGIAFV